MQKIKYRRVVTPTVIQMEATECGAACLGIILGYYGKYIPLEQLRIACGVSRDGSNAYYMIEAAKKYGLDGKGYSREFDDLYDINFPAILFWKFEHFVVLEGFKKDKVYINDPATGPRTVSYEDFDQAFTGVVLVFEPLPEFKKSRKPASILSLILKRLKGFREPVIYSMITGIFLVIPNLAFPAFSQVFIDKILINHVLTWKTAIVTGMIITAIMSGALAFLQGHTLNRLAVKLSMTFSSSTFWHMLKLPMIFYSQRYPGEIAYRLLLNDSVAHTIAGQLASTMINVLFAIVYGIAIFYYDVMIATTALISILLNFFLMHRAYRSRIDAYARLQSETGKSNAYSIGALENIETIKATGSEDKFFSNWIGYYTKVLNSLQDIGRRDIFLSAAAPLLSSFTTLAVLGIGGWKIINGQLTIGMLFAVQILLRNFIGPVLALINFTQSLQFLKVDISRLDDIMNNPIDPDLKDKPSSVIEPLAPELIEKETKCEICKLNGYVEAKNISFGYNPVGDPVVSEFHINLSPGKSIALVGPTGCGKSSIAKVIAGLYNRTEGELYFDSKLREDTSRDSIINSLSLVEPDPFLFHGTVKDNITLFDTTVLQEDLVKATKDACIHDEIISRANGYDSTINENGSNLSGGQRQRFEIARGLVKNPTILILDEATSALDSETEAQVIKNIRRRGCALLIIAHRLSSIKNCDQIIVMDKGKIIDSGTHDELKTRPGLYRELIESEHF